MAGEILLGVEIQDRGDFAVKSLLAILGTTGLDFIYFFSNDSQVTVMPFINALSKSHHTSLMANLSVSCPTLEVV